MPINFSTGVVSPPTYTTSFICKTCGIHWNAWAQFVDGAWCRDKHGTDPDYSGRRVIGAECDPFWRVREDWS